MVTIGQGNGGGAFLVPGLMSPVALGISNTLTFKADGTYKCMLSVTHIVADQIIAAGVTIESGAKFILRTRGNQVLSAGTTFTVINNTATTTITGTFANLGDGSTITVGSNTFQADYEGGDGNDLTLTVMP